MINLMFDSLEHAAGGFALLELIPDTHAWVKDTQGVFVCGNRLFYERFGISSVDGLIGKTDYDLSPADMAQKYRDDDDSVLNGALITDRLELILGPDDKVEWFLTSKWPIRDRASKILGTIGVSRHLNQSQRKTLPLRELSIPIEYINQHFDEAISVADLARACNCSVSALERRFKKHLGKTPVQYIKEVRLDHALRLLRETAKSVGTIALETGFGDHSHFTRAFTRHFEQSPREARQDYLLKNNHTG